MMPLQTTQMLVAEHQMDLHKEAAAHRLRRQIRAISPGTRRRRSLAR